jgi:hypothetical protein
VVHAEVRATSCSSRGTSGTRSGTRATHPAGCWRSSPTGFEHFLHKLGERMAEARAVSVAEVPDVAWLGARYGHYLQKASRGSASSTAWCTRRKSAPGPAAHPQPQDLTRKRLADLECSTTRYDIDYGRLICIINIAPLRSAEFAIFRLQQKTRINKPPPTVGLSAAVRPSYSLAVELS